jgi:hypothetical protein
MEFSNEDLYATLDLVLGGWALVVRALHQNRKAADLIAARRPAVAFFEAVPVRFRVVDQFSFENSIY